MPHCKGAGGCRRGVSRQPQRLLWRELSGVSAEADEGISTLHWVVHEMVRCETNVSSLRPFSIHSVG